MNVLIEEMNEKVVASVSLPVNTLPRHSDDRSSESARFYDDSPLSYFIDIVFSIPMKWEYRVHVLCVYIFDDERYFM